MGRNKYSQSEINQISKLLKQKCTGTRFQQKQVRHTLRVDFEFNISDFNVQGKAFGEEDLQDCIKRGAIRILDDATIASMKEKRERDKQKDAAKAQLEAIESGEQTDWKEAMKEWEDWERENKE